MTVILSRTRIMKNTIFVGPKTEKNCGLKILLNQRTQWCDYTEELMRITNVNLNKNSESSATLNQFSFPFRICDISLPQDRTGSDFFYITRIYVLCPHWINAVSQKHSINI